MIPQAQYLLRFKYFRFVDPSPHQLFPGDQCGSCSSTCLQHPPNGTSLQNNLKHPSQPPDLAEHNPGTHHVYHQLTLHIFQINVNTVVQQREVLKNLYSVGFTSEEPISKYLSGLTICLNRFTHTLIIQCIFMICSRWLVVFLVRQNQAAPLCVPLNRYHLFSPRS